MGKFNIRGSHDRYIEIISENSHEYLINYIKADCESDCCRQETMSKALFEYCISTGYFLK
jgi:hypothetical protein